MMFKTNSIDSARKLFDCIENPTIEISGKIKEIRPLLDTEFWPDAVPDGLIVKTEEQAKLRARSILYAYNMVGIPNTSESISDQMLDYGCGDGNTVLCAKEMGIDAYGYDIKPHSNWGTDNNAFTTDLANIRGRIFKHILIYDVLDHVTKEQAIDILTNVKKSCDSNTTISLRVHPWLSRHGAHTYYKINKAYAHLFLNEEELAVATNENVTKIYRPMRYYEELINTSGLKVVKLDIIRRPIEPFFKNAMILEKIKEITGSTGSSSDEWIDTVLSMEFIDYKLSI